eukprot:5005425-Lingulodinium_polyedra.AAC.1
MCLGVRSWVGAAAMSSWRVRVSCGVSPDDIFVVVGNVSDEPVDRFVAPIATIVFGCGPQQ